METLNPTIKNKIWNKQFDESCYGYVIHHTIHNAKGNGFYTYDVFCKAGGPNPVAHGWAMDEKQCIEKAKQGYKLYGVH